jgi:DNA-binding transcriptional MerR regulator
LVVTEEKETPETQETPETAEASSPEAEAEEPSAEQPPAEETDEGERYTRRQLEQLTVKKLRALALELGEITGVHGMSKEELVEAIFELRGIEEQEEAAVELAVDKSAIKREIRELKGVRDAALASGDAQALRQARARIKRLKRILRKVS